VADYAKDVLVEPDWLEQHLNDDSIRIVEVDENPALYREAHIPGAIGFDWKLDLQDQVRRDFLGAQDFAKLFGSRGIGDQHTIILYGDRNNWFAAYTYWYLKYYGHDNVKLLNGPRERWISEGRPTTVEEPNYSETTFEAKPGDESIRAKRDEVFAAIDDSRKLVDVRSPQEYSGELVAMPGYENEGAQRGGVLQDAADGPEGRVAQLRIAVLVVENRLVPVEHLEMHVHAAARITVKRLGHKGYGLAVFNSGIFYQVFQLLGSVSHFA